MLEERLEGIDRQETVPLRLGCSRRDNNSERISIVSDIEKTLAEYDELIERNHRILSLEAAKPRDIFNLQNWVNGNGYMARKETAYLTSHEVLSVAAPDDYAVSWLETLVEGGLVRLCDYCGKRYGLETSRDRNLFNVYNCLSRIYR
ncbi:hypothetical protein B0T26DRAFT_463760 [Lasiosphaeria miniovina]|uniref:DUF6594 domain-containing protein n=1 Tax=Lasiosphaeria miniovina TaxID=1954250 RepID=A0AA39ZZP8_9PEZI|nr:uncharacterized protein B0T26DRAFT_463760 [Lasiosphaeria miniovina]KAK0706615.1 hypothetical protein B0T26DRAFT_463760 [Lasiosphaeria miniovina]